MMLTFAATVRSICTRTSKDFNFRFLLEGAFVQRFSVPA
jgi:hypothetical protein